MTSQLPVAWLLLLLLLAAVLLPGRAMGAETKAFNMRPNVDDTVSLTQGSFTCSFSYSVVGGSSEQWLMMLDVYQAEGEDRVSCVISRPEQATSYLFFKGYTASMQGAEVNPDLYSTQDITLLEGEHYRVDMVEGKSTTVKPAPGWAGSISIIHLHNDT